jgi:hypothetical protein
MAVHGEAILRQRVCRGRDCHAVFWICQHCDRGQCYCSPACRDGARLEQRRRANCRHQRSPEGRLDHRDRQRDYRQRRRDQPALQARVTDQGSLSITSPVNIPEWDTPTTRTAVPRSTATVFAPRRPENRPRSLLHCIVCGRGGRFVDPFPRFRFLKESRR